MKVVIAGATGAIGGMIMQQALCRDGITEVIALTRKPLSNSIPHEKLKSIVIPDFGDLQSIHDETWKIIQDADALMWAVGTYNLNEDVNLNFPLAFQHALAKWLVGSSKTSSRKFRFILLGGAFVETDQSRTLYFLWGQRKMKGLLQTRTLEFAEAHQSFWEAIIIRPGGILFGGTTILNKSAELLFGKGLSIRAEDLGASVCELLLNGSDHHIIENAELVDLGKRIV